MSTPLVVLEAQHTNRNLLSAIAWLWRSWSLLLIYWVVIFYLLAALMLIVGACAGIYNINQDYPISSSIELVSVKGLLEPSLAPGEVPPAIVLLVRVENHGHYYDEYREGGGVTVSYAGVPLVRGRTPSFRVGAKETLAFVVNATTESSVGVPEDLSRLMSAERRHGAAQLDVVMQLGWPGWESYVWSVDLDG